MPDLLAHVLLAYVLCTALSWRFDWLDLGYVTAGMAGALIPDMTKAYLVVPDAAVESMLGVPFSWHAIHTTGGAVLGVLVGVTLVGAAERRRVGAVLALGATSHLVADALLSKPSGHSYAVFWPVSQYHPPTPGLYLSTQAEPTVVAAVGAAIVWGVTRWRTGE